MANEFEKLNEEELEQAAGGKSGIKAIDGGGSTHKTVTGLKTGYLALRSAPGYNYSNEIGQLYNGDKVEVVGETIWVNNDFHGKTTPYTKVRIRHTDKVGYVNANFLK